MKKLLILGVLLSPGLLQAQQPPKMDISKLKATLEAEKNANKEIVKNGKNALKCACFPSQFNAMIQQLIVKT
jgi:hypothetical protein